MVASTPNTIYPFGEEDSSKRRQILDGARKVFMDLGFDGASMNEIARAAGVSKGTLYVYFADKSRLFEAIVEDEALEKGKIAYNLDPGAMSKPRCGNSAGPNRFDVPARRRIVDPHGDGDRRTDAGGRTPVLRERAGEIDQPSRRLSAGPCRAERSDDRRLRLAAAQFLQMCQATLFLPFVFQAEPAPSAERIARVVDSATRLFLQTYRAKPK